jgi:hypothetical protein
MACSGSYCNNFGTGVTTCRGHRSVCFTNRPLSGWSPTAGRVIDSFSLDDLRVKIMQEIDRYNVWQSQNRQPLYSKFDPGALSVGRTIAASHVNNLAATLGITGQGGTNLTILATDWKQVWDRYNAVRQDCICNSDCSCNNVCACHNDCGCNYSDVRLKENVKFINTVNGLNIYSWNYIWDANCTYQGVLAQELLDTEYANAVKSDSNGFYMVDYKKLPI